MRLSPGIVQGCFELLDIISRNGLTFSQIRSSFSFIGNQPVDVIIESIQFLKWLRANEYGLAVMTPAGSHLASIAGYEPRLRQSLLDYIDVEKPAWVQNATFGRSRLLSFVGYEVGQIFIEAGLAHSIEDEVVAFWDSLAARARGLKSDKLSAIGRMGERLTIAYEVARTGHMPKWISIDNNADGYDVLSIVTSENASHLSIEVKTSNMGCLGHMHLTRNEWDRSQEVDNHVFHLWALGSANAPALAIIEPAKMLSQIPCDNGHGIWESVEIPFSIFEDDFKPA